MDVSRAGNGRIFDLLGQPLRILRLDPAATNQQIHDAFSRAQRNPMAAPAALIFARDALLDPNRRLACELSYPLDCPASQVETFFAALSSDDSIDELLNFSDRLWPLARANFVAHIASHRPSNGTLLYALLESHAAMDATDIYAKLKASRAAAEIPSPSWISVNQGLEELLNSHAAAALAGYDTIQDAAEPVLECTKQILANGERHSVEALGSFLGPYRQATAPPQTDASQQIASACAAMKQQPSNVSLVEGLSNAVLRWTSLSKPLLMWDAHQGRQEPAFETPIEQLRSLIADLTKNEHYDVAIKVTGVTRDVFRAVPTTIDQLAEDARLIASLSQRSNIKLIQHLIDEFEADPDPLIAALEKEGFGQTSTEPAKRLWEAFVQAANSTPSDQLSWQLMHDFAIRFSNKPEAAAAVARLLSGLIEYGARVSAAPKILKALRDNLNFMKSFMGTDPAAESNEAIQNSTKGSFFSKFFRKLSRRGPHLEPNRKRKHLIRAAGLVLIALAALGLMTFYIGFDEVRFWSKASIAALIQRTIPTLGTETMPAVGTGQHLALDGVRYCHFQQERLRIIKKEISGPEDTRAYNLLIIDYNSRCSDYFYQDNDLKLVLAEVSAKKNLLEADAKQIMSTWPGHSAAASPKN